MKEIHFYTSEFPSDKVMLHSYVSVKDSIGKGDSQIHTTQMCMMSFDLIDLGYEIYLHSEDDSTIKIEPGMTIYNGKELRRGHNLLRLFMAGALKSL